MNKLVNIREAANLTGLSFYALRLGVKSGRFPVTRAGSSSGKLLFDPDLLQQVLRQELTANIRFEDEDEAPELVERSYLAGLFQVE